uniref:Uncharacterized protein n=1 Tax=Noccaea caerulescens TaxID=107243 RepID=A0A1J3ILW1_NOCCA
MQVRKEAETMMIEENYLIFLSCPSFASLSLNHSIHRFQIQSILTVIAVPTTTAQEIHNQVGITPLASPLA